MSKNENVVISGFNICCPFTNYIKVKEDWRKNNPHSKITEEIKTLGMGNIEVPDPQRIGSTKSVQCIVIYWAIIYSTPESKVLKNANQLSIN